MRPALLLITYYWPPAGGAGVQRWLKFVKYLTRAGYKVIVITVDPDMANYPQRDPSLANEIPEHVTVITTCTREPFSAYKKVTSNKETPFGGFSNQNRKNFREELAKFVRGNFFLPDARRGWNRYATAAAIKIIEQENIKILVTTSPPHSTQITGLKLKKRFPQLQWIADLRDPWTSIYYYRDLYPTLPARVIDRSMERKVVQKADDVIVVSRNIRDEFAKHLSRKDGDDKIHIIPNGFDHEDIPEGIQAETPFTVTYTGTISPRYPYQTLLKAIQSLPVEISNSLRWRFVGQVPVPVQRDFIEILKDKVIFEGQVSHQQAIRFLLKSSLNLLLIPDTPNNKGILTGKLFEYLGVKRPILCIGPVEGEASAIIAASSSGRTFEPGDISGVAEYLQENLAGVTGITFEDVDRYNRQELTRQLEALFPVAGGQQDDIRT